MELRPTQIVTRFDKQDVNNMTMIISDHHDEADQLHKQTITNSANFRIRGCYQDFSRSRRTSCLLLLAAACIGHRGIDI